MTIISQIMELPDTVAGFNFHRDQDTEDIIGILILKLILNYQFDLQKIK